MPTTGGDRTPRAARTPAKSPRQPAHRPSRRQVIIEAAVHVFAQKGFVDSSVQDVAKEAEVVPTAVYYHFAGKEDLFDAALRSVMDRLDEVVVEVRGRSDQVDESTLGAVAGAVWDWIEAHPDDAQLLYVHLPGATPKGRELRREFEETHVRQAFDYVSPGRIPRSRKVAQDRYVATTLAVRTMIGMTMAIHPLRLGDGPLHRQSSRALRRSLQEISERIVLID